MRAQPNRKEPNATKGPTRGRVKKRPNDNLKIKETEKTLVKKSLEAIEENGLVDIINRQREIFNKDLSPKSTKNIDDKPRKKGRPRKIVKLINPENNNLLTEQTGFDILTDGRSSLQSDADLKVTDREEDLIIPLSKNADNSETNGFKCGICSKVLPDKAEMIKHVRTHARDRPYKCFDCDASFAQLTALRTHETIHTGDKPFACDLCGRRFAVKDRLRNHMQVHMSDKCNDAAKSNEESELNGASGKENDDSNQLADTESEKDLPANEKTKNGPTKKESSSYVVCFSKESGGVKVKYFKCRICSKQTSAKADLIKHIRVHTGERPFKCKSCDASFVQVTALRGHETIHTGEKPFVCDLCGNRFAIKDRLRLHMRVHTGEKPHNCAVCNQAFARRSQVSQHMRIHSTNKESFKCEECDSTFASYHTLKAHINKHRGIKEFQCPACGKKFLRVEGLYKHIRTVHRGNRPYTCNICGKAFKGHLQQHMRLHMGIRPYSCHLCDASFTQNSQLTVHLRIHTGERPYKCQVCGSSFAHSSACKIHMRSHTGEKPFKCVICNQPFSQLPHLKKHMKCVHRADKPYLCVICREFFQTQEEIDNHKRFSHNVSKSPEEEAQEVVEDSTLARLRNRLAVLLYRISSEDRRTKFGFGQQLVDEVLKLSLQSSGHTPISDSSLTRLEELRQNVFLLLRWTIPKETMEEYHRNNMTVDEVLDMLTS